MRFRSALLSITVLAAVACHKSPPKPPPLGVVLPNLPLPPHAQPLASESGGDATQVIIVSSDPPDTIANYYRKVLARDPFRLINERTNGQNTQFYAEQNGPPIWITVSPNGSAGTQVTIAGATDSAGAKRP